MNTAVLIALAAAAVPIEVRILSSHHPGAVEISRGGAVYQIAARGDRVIAGGAEVRAPFRLERGEWSVRLPRQEPRRYLGELSLSASRGELAIILRVELEEYVAAVIAAETPSDTPAAALRAQAIVTRSYVLARRRHVDARVCDLTHCQAFYGQTARFEAAEVAARATAGLVLGVEGGAIADGIFHAACGGHTADPRQVFGGEDGSGARAVADHQCAAPWEAAIDAGVFERVAGGALEDLRFERGRGGFVVRVVDARSGRIVSGDAFARALDRAMGWGVVRSARFEARREGSAVYLRGNGWGHGAGLCQAGAARMAEMGAGEREILAHFFPRARIAPRK